MTVVMRFRHLATCRISDERSRPDVCASPACRFILPHAPDLPSPGLPESAIGPPTAERCVLNTKETCRTGDRRPGKRSGVLDGAIGVPGKRSGLQDGAIGVPGKRSGVQDGAIGVPGKRSACRRGDRCSSPVGRRSPAHRGSSPPGGGSPGRVSGENPCEGHIPQPPYHEPTPGARHTVAPRNQLTSTKLEVLRSPS
jgi:hypothetical protein